MTDLSQLGAGALGAHGPGQLEAFPCSSLVRRVELVSAELLCRCPVTGQPDVYVVSVRYVPNVDAPKALETKSVKLWFWSFRDRTPGTFAEDIAVELVAGVMGSSAAPAWCEVVLTQNVRGGIVTTVTANQGEHP